MDVIPFGLLPDLVALGLIAPVFAYVFLQAPAPAVRVPLRIGVAGTAMFILGSTGPELLAGDGVRWASLILVYGGHMLSVPAWASLAVRAAKLHGQSVPRSLDLAVRLSPWLFAILFFGFVTNPLHGEFLRPGANARNDFQSIWYVFAASAYGLGLSTVFLYGKMAFRQDTKESRQLAFAMALATLLPFAANLLYLLLPIPGQHDPTSAGYALSALILVHAWYRGPLLTLTPVAFSGLLEHDPDLVILTDTYGRVHYVNPSARDFFGPATLHVGAGIAGSLGPDVRIPGRRHAMGISEMQDLVAHGVVDEVQIEYLPNRRVLKLSRFEIPAALGSPQAVALRFRDETELFEARKGVREKASTLEAVLRSSRDGFLITDVDSQVQYFNARMLQISSTIAARADSFDSEALWAQVRKGLETPEQFDEIAQAVEDRPWGNHKIELGLRDGRTLEVIATTLLEGQEITGRVWQIHDCTDQRRSEEALRNAQKLESLGVMAGGIAHDFNNLLVGVLGNAEIARLSLERDDPAREPLAAVQLAAEQASDLTRQLLAYAGQDDNISFGPLDLRDVVTEGRELLAVVTPKSVRLDVELPREPASVVGDGSQLRQVLMNLVTNAAEAMEGKSGTVAIQVDTGREVANEDPTSSTEEALECYVRLRVADDGCGMSAETQDKMFDPFFTTKFEGRGLGLAATLGIVRGHGGSLRVESRLDGGTCFEVRLPIHEAVGRARQGAAGEVSFSGEGKILVVDDEMEVRKVARAMLRRLGFEVTECVNGHEALAAVEKEPHGYHAVLLDLAMPLMSGLDVAERLAEHHPELPVILCSGYPPSAENDLPQVSAFLRKPFTLEHLREAFRQVLGEASRPEKGSGEPPS